MWKLYGNSSTPKLISIEETDGIVISGGLARFCREDMVDLLLKRGADSNNQLLVDSERSLISMLYYSTRRRIEMMSTERRCFVIDSHHSCLQWRRNAASFKGLLL